MIEDSLVTHVKQVLDHGIGSNASDAVRVEHLLDFLDSLHDWTNPRRSLKWLALDTYLRRIGVRS